MASRLEVWANTFQTSDEALEIVADRVDCGGFEAATPLKQESALIQAFHSLKRLPFVVSVISETTPFNVLDLTEEQLESLPAAFLYALRSAQVVQADSLLGFDATSLEGQIAQKRQAGILEERIGESSQKYAANTSTMISFGARQSINTRALAALAGWVYDTVRIARA